MHRGESRRSTAFALHDDAEQEKPAHAELLEKKKYNPFLKRHTLHRETK